MKTPITTLIVDDEDLAREKIRFFLADDPECQVLGECSNGFQAIEAVCDIMPDVIFLDIQMPELDGFETLRMIQGFLEQGISMPLVVFITAYDHFALKAFEAHAADYLLKPFDYKRFETMLVRVKDHVRNRQARAIQESLLKELATVKNQNTRHFTERFAFKTRGRIYFVDVDHVEWIEADKNYALFHVGELTHVLRTAFGDLVEQLDPARFIRIHRSIIIQKNYIREIIKRSDRSYAVITQSGETLGIGTGYRADVFATMRLQSPPTSENNVKE